jgi:putative selenate reductase molybdopterin-binding subunit
MADFKSVGRSVKKLEGLSLATGTERFVADLKLEDPLHLAMLYSPHAFAEIESIDPSEALKVEGVVDIFHHGNVQRVLHTTAGQGFPEPSPYDALLFDRKVRFVGDNVALVAAETEAAAREAVAKIKVRYKVLEPLFDPERAMEPGAPKLHSDDEYAPIPVTYDPSRNLAAELEIGFGDLEKGFEEADFIEEHSYQTQYASHCAIEPHAALAYTDERGRLVIISTTQVPFHARRITAQCLQLPVGTIRVIKPRIGGGFGGKQEVLLEPFVALVAWKHKRPARFVFSRREVFIAGRMRNPMRVRMKMGFKKDGEITAIDMSSLLNTGAYASHALTVLANSGGKVLPLYNKVPNVHFLGRSVYTNYPVGGAYRGYGATKGYFAFNQQIDMICRKTKQDILEYHKRWHIKEGETSEVFKALGEGKEGVAQTINSCKLSECIDAGAATIDWYAKRDKKIKVAPDKVKGVGVAVSMQGSGIPDIDMGSARMKMNEDGSFNLYAGATDIGTGSDTILAQIAAEALSTSAEKMIVLSSDTDLTPFDVGAYASSTTYVSGNAVRKCAEKVREQILSVAADMMGCRADDIVLKGGVAKSRKGGPEIPFGEVCIHALYTRNQFQIEATASNVGTESPPPFAAQFAEVDVDTRTGRVAVVAFVSAVDCGQAINPSFAEGQIEGATLNGISYALCEEYLFDRSGRMTNPNFGDYKIYTTRDLPEMTTIIAQSYEKTGPFGAKAVGEIAINGPMPAIANAIFDAVGVRMLTAPFTPERVYAAIKAKG